ncbi:MAG: MerR family transcriptional regulator [Tissierellia bacterium]|nr:MerR family transcriptional regulator [Tissierellia bacterium]
MLEVDKQYSISEVAEITSYPPHVLRYYEKEFELEIPRNESNHRYYTYKEIELFQYIKSLQEQGFSNKQIKLIMNSPELLITSNEEVVLTNISSQDKIDSIQLAKDISSNLYIEIFDELTRILNENTEHSVEKIEALKEEIINLRKELNSKERDVLICENAKLKMKIKEKSYQVAELKDKIKRMENNESFIRRIFKTNKG